MSTRRSHFKSRNGCEGCKKRRVKCDELGPPCANCVIRRSCCEYKTAPSSWAVETPERSRETGTESSARHPDAAARSSKQRLELELIHRFTSSTYKRCSSMEAEHHLTQVTMVREALKHEFLLDTLLSLAAFDMAVEAGGQTDAAEYYAGAALDYYDRAVRGFTALVGAETEENHLAMFGFVSNSLMLCFVVPRFRAAAADDDENAHASGPGRRTLGLVFDARPTLQAVTQRCWSWLQKSPVHLDAFLRQNLPYSELSTDVRQSMARLICVNDDYKSQRMASNAPETSPDLDHESYESAIMQLEGIFARDIDGTVKGTVITWTLLVDARFVANFTGSDPMALLIAMHWGVLVNDLGKLAWWASHAGSDLIAELSALLQSSAWASSPMWQESIAWTREKVGLPSIIR